MNRAPPPPPHPAATFLPSYYPIPPPPPPPSVTSALSELSSLLHLSTTALSSLPTAIDAATSSSAAAKFVSCPFNSNHRLPPSYLFSHYLNCPSPLSLSHTFRYPLTRRDSTSAGGAPPIPPPDSSELTVSLENCIDYNAPANSFFYQDCPGPVTPSAPPPSSVSLPRVVYTKCADFIEKSRLEVSVGFSLDFIRFLPSEIWAIRGEIESWGGGFPASYSSRILRAILRLRDCKLLHLHDWIIANSPRYGVIIDCAMRDHVALLVKLCLKAIVGEALELARFTHSDGELKEMKNSLQGLGNRSFECPVLVEVMVWLALQFSVLYGEVNGKYFAVDVLKECVLNSASRASLFSLEGKDGESSEGGNDGGSVDEQVQSAVSIDNTEQDRRGSIECETVAKRMIFISEVAAAVAALHERTFIEEKIKAFRNARPPSTYQRNMEHALVSKIADEERQKRPNYRPVIEYDGFLRHRSSNQDTNKVKTKEELLAEERDYKRRRMSYRGKKLKRNPVEVLRGIIEEYMEEMRQAGGVGESKSVEKTNTSASKNMERHARAAHDSETRRNSEFSEENRAQSVDHWQDMHSHQNSRDFKDDNPHRRHDSRRQYSNKSIEGIQHDRYDVYETRDKRQIDNHSRGQIRGREKSDFVETFSEDDSRRSQQRRSESQDRKYHKSTRDDHEQTTDKRRRDEHDRSNNRKRGRGEDYWEHEDRERNKRDRVSKERDGDKRGHEDRRKGKSNRSSSSRRELHEFDDRYDPTVSHDLYEDDH